MSVYVDALVDRGWSLGPNCHLVADTLAELHEFAARIGMRERWYQDTSHPHYDLTAARRAAAVRYGAVEVGRQELVEWIRKRRVEGRTWA